MKLGQSHREQERFLLDDVATEDRNYSFLYQLTHITKDRDALTHDDRIDAVAGAVAHFQRAMMIDIDRSGRYGRRSEPTRQPPPHPHSLLRPR